MLLYLHRYVYTYTHVCIPLKESESETLMLLYLHRYTYTYTHVCIYLCTHLHMWIFADVYIDICIQCTHIYVYYLCPTTTTTTHSGSEMDCPHSSCIMSLCLMFSYSNTVKTKCILGMQWHLCHQRNYEYRRFYRATGTCDPPLEIQREVPLFWVVNADLWGRYSQTSWRSTFLTSEICLAFSHPLTKVTGNIFFFFQKPWLCRDMRIFKVHCLLTLRSFLTLSPSWKVGAPKIFLFFFPNYFL